MKIKNIYVILKGNLQQSETNPFSEKNFVGCNLLLKKYIIVIEKQTLVLILKHISHDDIV